MKRMCWEGGAWKLPKDWQALETTAAGEWAHICVHVSLELSLYPRWLLYTDYGVTYASGRLSEHLPLPASNALYFLSIWELSSQMLL